ncbi:MAG: lasso peptide biosynthesis B2 protein [Pseudomonadota bacterium]
MYRLAPDIHACLVGETPVLLDAAAGRYLIVRGQTGRHLRAFLKNEPTAPICDALVNAGLIELGPGSYVPASSVERPTYSHLPDVRLGKGWALLPFASILLALAFARVRRAGFRPLLESLQHEASRHSKSPRPFIDEARIAATFELARRLFPLKDQCLPYSIAITRMMRIFGHQPIMVVGVRLPIGAHCWVQCEHRIVGDIFENVEPFEPILVI